MRKNEKIPSWVISRLNKLSGVVIDGNNKSAIDDISKEKLLVDIASIMKEINDYNLYDGED